MKWEAAYFLWVCGEARVSHGSGVQSAKRRGKGRLRRDLYAALRCGCAYCAVCVIPTGGKWMVWWIGQKKARERVEVSQARRDYGAVPGYAEDLSIHSRTFSIPIPPNAPCTASRDDAHCVLLPFDGRASWGGVQSAKHRARSGGAAWESLELRVERGGVPL